MPPTGMAAPSPVTHFEIIAQRTAKHFKITTKKKPRPRPAQLEDVEPADHPLGQSPVKATKGARGAQVPPVQVAGAGEAVKAPLSERSKYELSTSKYLVAPLPHPEPLPDLKVEGPPEVPEGIWRSPVQRERDHRRAINAELWHKAKAAEAQADEESAAAVARAETPEQLDKKPPPPPPRRRSLALPAAAPKSAPRRPPPQHSPPAQRPTRLPPVTPTARFGEFLPKASTLSQSQSTNANTTSTALDYSRTSSTRNYGVRVRSRLDEKSPSQRALLKGDARKPDARAVARRMSRLGSIGAAVLAGKGRDRASIYLCDDDWSMLAKAVGDRQYDGLRIPIPEYLSAKKIFQKLDADRTGLLSWADLKDVQIHHRLVDLATFRRMDNNRSGYVDFGDLLRGLYPTIPPKDVLRQVKLLGAPDGAVADSGDEEDLRWRENFSEDQQQEIEAIFLQFVGPHAASPLTQQKLSREQVRRCVSDQDMSDDLFTEMFEAADQDRDGHLSLAEFALVLEDLYRDPRKGGGREGGGVVMYFDKAAQGAKPERMWEP